MSTADKETTPRSTILLNSNLYSDSDEQLESRFPNESDDDEGGLIRALPSNKFNWDNVRHYSSIVTSRPDVLNGLIKPPQATFFDHQDLEVKSKRSKGGHSSKSVKAHVFTITTTPTAGTTTLAPSPSNHTHPPALNNSPSGPPLSSSSAVPFQSEQPQRNTLRAATSNFIKQQVESNPNPSTTLNSPTSVKLHNTSAIFASKPAEQDQDMDTRKVKDHKDNNNAEEHEFVTKILAQRRLSQEAPPPPPPLAGAADVKTIRRSSIGFELDMNFAMTAIPPPPDTPTKTAKLTMPDSPSAALHSQRDKPASPTPRITSTASSSPPMHPSTDRRTRRDNMSRTEEEMMQLYTKPLPPFPSKILGSTPVPSPSVQQKHQQQDQHHSPLQPPASPVQSRPPSTPTKVARPKSPVAAFTILPNNPSPISSEGQEEVCSPPPQITPVPPQELYQLYKRAVGDAPDAKNDVINAVYKVPELQALIELGVLLTFAQYTMDTHFDDKGLNPTPKSKLKLQPATLSVTKLLESELITQLLQSSCYNTFSSKLNKHIIQIPFEIPVDIHPRSFGVSLLLTAATVHIVSIESTEMNSHYQQCAAFFLVLAIVLQIGVHYSPSSLIPYEQSPTSLVRSINNKNTTNQNDTPVQEDCLFYLSLVINQLDYQYLYTLYTKHNPLSIAQTKPQSRHQYNSDKETAIDYALLPQIEHQTGLRFYQLASISEDAFTTYYDYIKTLPQLQHQAVTRPPFLSPTDCYVVGYMLWLKSAYQSYSPSISDVSWVRYSGYGVQRDFDLAFHWVYLAATLNDPRAMNNLGLYYKKGIGSQQADMARAYHWLHKAKAAKYTSLSAKTLQVLEKQLNLINIEPHNNPYLSSEYSQLLSTGPQLVPLDTWDNWIIGCDTYTSDKYDVANTTGLFNQKQRVDVAYQLSISRLRQFPPLIQKSYAGYDVLFNASIILAMIPRPYVQNLASNRRASIGNLARRVSLGVQPQGQIAAAAIATTQSTTAPSSILPFPTQSLPPTPQTPLPSINLNTFPSSSPQSPQHALPALPSIPQHELPNSPQPLPNTFTRLGSADPTLPNTPQRPSIFARKASLTLTRPQTFTLSQQDILALQHQQHEIHQGHLLSQNPQAPGTQVHSTPLLKTPIRPNVERILAADILDRVGTNVSAENDQINVTITQPVISAPIVGNLSRIDSVSYIDPVTHHRTQQDHVKTLSEAKYLQQDSIPPPPPPPEDEDEEQQPNIQVVRPESITGSARTTTPRNSPLPSVVSIPAPAASPVPNRPPIPNRQPVPNRPSVSFNQPTTAIHPPSRHAPGWPSPQNSNAAIPEGSEVEYQPSERASFVSGMISTSSNATRRSSIGGQPVMINVHPIQRTTDMSDADWKRLTTQQYRQTLAKMMNLTRDGYITRIDHLNQLAELRVLYSLSPDHHQTEYHLCKQLFDKRAHQETEHWQMTMDRKRTMSTMQKTMRLEQLEKDLAQQKKKEAAEGPRDYGTCLSCKAQPASQRIEPCKHYCICPTCATTKRIRKCPYCGGEVAAISSEEPKK